MLNFLFKDYQLRDGKLSKLIKTFSFMNLEWETLSYR